MKIEFDSVKNERNIQERGISFELAANFDLKTAKIWIDTRKDYGEERFIALGYIGKRLFSMVFTVREDVLRILALEKQTNERNVFMKIKPNPELIDEENPEWTATMFAEAKSANELFLHLIKPIKKSENNFIIKKFYYQSTRYIYLNFISPLH